MTLIRQGEADLIIDVMAEHALSSLLPRGTKTWQCGDYETTIDLTNIRRESAPESRRNKLSVKVAVCI